MRPAPELTAPKVICHNPRGSGAVCPVASAGLVFWWLFRITVVGWPGTVGSGAQILRVQEERGESKHLGSKLDQFLNLSFFFLPTKLLHTPAFVAFRSEAKK